MKNEEDTLKITKNKDGTFAMQWDRNDPKWKWMNELTSKEIEIILQQAIAVHHESD